MPICPVCGLEITEGVKRCSICGTRVGKGERRIRTNKNEIPVRKKTIAYLVVFAIIVISVSMYVVTKLSYPEEEELPATGSEYISAGTGGTITYDKIQIAIPPNALFKDSTITVSRASALPPPDYRIIGDVYDVQPTGTRFRIPVTVTLSYSDDDIPAGVREAEITMGVREAEITMEGPAKGWVKLKSDVDTIKNTVSAKVSSFTQFAILALENENALAVTVWPNIVIVNKTTDISVCVKTYDGEPVEGAKVTIKSKVIKHPDKPSTSVSGTTAKDGIVILSVKPTINDLYGLTVRANKTGFFDGFTEIFAAIDLSYKDLCADWDRNTQKFRTFVSGETVNIKDKVVEVIYYPSVKLNGKDVALTVLKLESIVDTIYEDDLIAFIGDYRLEYKTGDTISIPLHIKQYEIEGKVIVLAEEQYNYKYAEIPTGEVPEVAFTTLQIFEDVLSASIGLYLETAQEVGVFKAVLYEGDIVIDSQDPLTMTQGPHIAFIDDNSDGFVSTGDFIAISNLKTNTQYTFKLYYRPTGSLLDASTWRM